MLGDYGDALQPEKLADVDSKEQLDKAAAQSKKHVDDLSNIGFNNLPEKY